MANVVTVSRLFLLALCVGLLYMDGGAPKFVAFFLIILLLYLDTVDGQLARRRGEVTALGSVLDIAIDRVVENVFWITFLDLRLVPLWIPLLVVTRGILTDAVRGFALARGMTAFGMMQTGWGKFLVSSRFMRGAYGFLKSVVFCYLAGLLGLQAGWPGTPNAHWLPALTTLGLILAILTVTVTVLRGAPVLIEGRRLFTQPNLE